MNDSQVRELLNNNPWLNSISNDAKSQLIEVAKIRFLQAEQRVHSKNEAADGLYCVLQGEVRISATTLTGDEIVFTRIPEGNWFGEISILDGGVRTHDAHTTTGSALALLPQQALLKVCQQNSEVYRALVNLLCSHCRTAFSAIDDFLLYTPGQRMAKRLLNQVQDSGSRITMTQQELGAMIGVSRQSTNKILRSWEQSGWIKRNYKGLEVIELGALRKLAGIEDN